MPTEFFQQIIDDVYEEIANNPNVTNAALVPLSGHNLRDVQRATKHLKDAGQIAGTKNIGRMEWTASPKP